jgi:hypothetical protein
MRLFQGSLVEGLRPAGWPLKALLTGGLLCLILPNRHHRFAVAVHSQSLGAELFDAFLPIQCYRFDNGVQKIFRLSPLEEVFQSR